MKRKCRECKKEKPLEKFELQNGNYKWQCYVCRNVANSARSKRKPTPTPTRAPVTNNPWELLCADSRPDWSKT